MEEAKVTANKEQLESIGIDYDITNLEGTVKGYYDSGYVQVEIEHKDGKVTFTNNFDIPKHWLKIIPKS